MNVDSTVYDLAADFVEDTLLEAHVQVSEEQRRAYIRRGAEAMQQAIEEECSVIAAELREA
jgi:hypothetical protein